MTDKALLDPSADAAVPPVIYKTPYVTVFEHSHEGDEFLTAGDWNV